MSSQKWTIYNPSFQSDDIDKQLDITPWSTNRRFAYDLVRFMKPNTIVELGSHYGCSLFCFAQAMKDGRLSSTRLYGVDTWKGDKQAGFYNEDIIKKVKTIKDKAFSKQDITLLRMTFRQALEHFKDGSIDLLHIDGFHTYRAVKDDYETWLPKLEKDGVILFHDVYGEAKLKKYGSVRHWKKLAAKYPHYQLNHNWGLGVLFPKGDKRYVQLKNEHIEDLIGLYEIASMEELYKNRLKKDLEWQADKTSYWWEQAMDFRFKLKALQKQGKNG